jgi:hypothetical protein
MVNKVHHIRNIVSHANDIDMSSYIFTESIACLIEFSKLIHTKETLVHHLEQDWIKYTRQFPSEKSVQKKGDKLKERILSVIEEKVLLKAVNFDDLEPDIKLSVDRTTLRLHSMRTIEEIMGFFSNAMHSERGLVVEKSLHEHGLLAFEDIKDEITALYNDNCGLEI